MTYRSRPSKPRFPMFSPAEVKVGDVIEEYDGEGVVRIKVEKVDEVMRREGSDRWTQWTFSGHRNGRSVAIRVSGPVPMAPYCGVRFVKKA